MQQYHFLVYNFNKKENKVYKKCVAGKSLSFNNNNKTLNLQT
jgi:hypothetical protein